MYAQPQNPPPSPVQSDQWTQQQSPQQGQAQQDQVQQPDANNQQPDPDPMLQYYREPLIGSDGQPIDHADTQLFDIYDPYIENLYFSPPIKNAKGGTSIYINPYEGANQSLRVQLCSLQDIPLRAPFGVQDGVQGSDPSRKTLELSIENDRLLQFLQRLDHKTLYMAKANRLLWFRKNLNDVNIEDYYQECCRFPPEPQPGETKKDFKPLLRTKVQTDGKYATKILIKRGESKDEDGNLTMQLEQGTWKDLGKHVRVVPIVDIISVWFMAKQFGVLFQCAEILIIPETPRPSLSFKMGGGQNCRVRMIQPDNVPQPTDHNNNEDEDLQQYIDGSVPSNDGDQMNCDPGQPQQNVAPQMYESMNSPYQNNMV